MNYENLLSKLTDEEIHKLNRNTFDCDKLESAINNWFLDITKYNEQEMIHNIEIEAENNNVFSMLTLAIWYREGNHVCQSDSDYIHTLENILSVNTEKLNSKTTLIELQTNKVSSKTLYDDVLGESALQLGQYYLNSTTKSEIKKAEKFFELSKWYAPKTVALSLPLLALKTASVATGIIGFASVPIVGKFIVAGGLVTLGARYLKNKIHKNDAIPQEHKSLAKLSPEQIAINDFGLLWNKLSNSSQDSIITAYKTFYTFANDNNYDFSSIIGLLGKALEGELKIRFYDGYIKYLSEKFELRSCILYRKNQICQFCDYANHSKFSIGSFRYVIGIDKSGYCIPIKKTFCDQSLINYTKEILYKDIFQNKTNKIIDDILKELSDNIETLRRYRNQADHPGVTLTVEDANKVLLLLIYTRKILLRILDPFVPFTE